MPAAAGTTAAAAAGKNAAGSGACGAFRVQSRAFFVSVVCRYAKSSRCNRTQTNGPPMTAQTTEAPSAPMQFRELALSEPLLKVLGELGYETPSPIQAATIPPLLARPRRARPGPDRHRQDRRVRAARSCRASTLDRDASRRRWCWRRPANWRIQVAEAFQRYATHMPGFHVLPIYGGQSYGPQLSRTAARRARGGRHPGPRHRPPGARLARPVRSCSTLVLDEADEMLRMGFIDDVEAILKKTPADAPGRRCSRPPCRRRSAASPRPT